MIVTDPCVRVTERQYVTDSPQWQPPADLGSPTTPSAPPFAPPAGAPLPPQQQGQQPTPGWTPPPKPGLIPLRPLTLGTLLGASFQVLRRNPRPMFGFALLLTGIVFVFTLLSVGLVTVFAFSRLDSASSADADTVAAGSFAALGLSALVPAVFSIVVTAILQGIVALEVARGTVGEKLKLGGLWRAARGRLGALIGWTLLVMAAVIIGITVVAVIIGALVALGGAVGVGVGILIGILSALGAVVLSFWLGTRLALVPSVLMLERLPLRAAIGRSWSLTTGFFWRTLGIQLLVAVIVQTVAGVITTPLSLVFGFATAFLNPNGDPNAMVGTLVVLYIVTAVVTLIFGAIAAVVQSATTALIYIDIRMRKEGLDLELTRFVEARQAGDSTVPDPYLPRTQPA